MIPKSLEEARIEAQTIGMTIEETSNGYLLKYGDEKVGIVPDFPSLQALFVTDGELNDITKEVARQLAKVR